MHPLVRRFVRFGKLSYLWLVRILGAPNHYQSTPVTKARMNAKGFLADQHTLYDLENNEAGDYLSEFDWYRSRWINEPFDAMLNNKIIFTEVLRDAAYVPRVLFIKNKGRMWTYEGPQRMSTLDVGLDVVRDAGAVFMKPIASGKGTGVHRVEARPEAPGATAWSLDGVAVDERAVRTLMVEDDGWFFSEAVEQHEALATIFPGSTNTIRIITMRDPESGEVDVFFAVLRLGTAATVPVDNGSRGGLVSQIDLDRGTLSRARSLWVDGWHSRHPDTGAAIEGVAVPNWEAVKDKAVRLANRFPYLQFVAWDILVTADGPCVIEANTSSGVNIIQLWGPQRNGKLGDFYRAHGVIK